MFLGRHAGDGQHLSQDTAQAEGQLCTDVFAAADAAG
jgi:hypothetical protein